LPPFLLVSSLRQERPRLDVKVASELGDLAAVEFAFAGEDFGNGRFGNPGAGLGLSCSLQLCYSSGMAADLRNVDPAELRLPSSRSSGADPVKLHRQIVKHGTSTAGMPPLLAYEGSGARWNSTTE
jgi:hypothetical protein